MKPRSYPEVVNLLILHQNFVDPAHPGGTRHYELAQRLAAAGHRVVIVAADVDYLSGQKIPRPAGGRHEQMGPPGATFEVRRAFALAGTQKSLFRRVLSYLVFMWTSFWVVLRTPDIDVIFGTTPPIFQLAAAWLAAKLRRRPFVLEVRDLWPAFAVDMGILKNRFLIWLAERIERFFYHAARHVIVNSPAYATHVQAAGVPAERITVIPNGVDCSQFDPQGNGEAIRRQFEVEDKFLVVYAGALGPANDIGTILSAAEHLRHEPAIHILLVGGGKEEPRLTALARTKKLDNVTFGGTLPKQHMPELLAAADACLATLQNIPMFRTTYPNKVFDYMAAGRPTVLAIDGVIREVVDDAHGGLFVPPGDATALAEALRHLAADPDMAHRLGASAREYVAAHFDRDEQAARLEEVLSGLL